jgi:hypothetical protein
MVNGEKENYCFILHPSSLILFTRPVSPQPRPHHRTSIAGCRLRVVDWEKYPGPQLATQNHFAAFKSASNTLVSPMPRLSSS